MLGTTGEFLSLTQEQKIKLLEVVTESFSGNILVGVSNNDDLLMEELAVIAEKNHVL